MSEEDDLIAAAIARDRRHELVMEGGETFLKRVTEVVEFAAKAKKRLISLDKLGVVVRMECPNPMHAGEVPPRYLRVLVLPRGRGGNPCRIQCEDPSCHYRMIE